MKAKNSKQGQSTLEYAVIIVVVVGALVLMQWYIKGGYQGKLKQASDELGDQYSPTQIFGNVTITTNTDSTENIAGVNLNAQNTSNPRITTDYTQNQMRNVVEDLIAINAAVTGTEDIR